MKSYFQRAGGWCEPVIAHYFRLGVVDDESNGKNRYKK